MAFQLGNISSRMKSCNFELGSYLDGRLFKCCPSVQSKIFEVKQTVGLDLDLDLVYFLGSRCIIMIQDTEICRPM